MSASAQQADVTPKKMQSPTTRAGTTMSSPLQGANARPRTPITPKGRQTSPRVSVRSPYDRVRSPSTPRTPADPVRIGSNNPAVYIPSKADDKYSFLSLSK